MHEDLSRPRVTLGEVTQLLSQRYGFRKLSSPAIPATHYDNDEELRPGVDREVLTTTSRRTLVEAIRYCWGGVDEYLACIAEFDREAIEFGYTVEDEDCWVGFETGAVELDFYDLMNVQLSLAQRINVTLEVEDGLVTGFKVDGYSGLLVRRHLTAVVGHPEPNSNYGESVPVMRFGDRNDEMLLDYLSCREEFGLNAPPEKEA